MAKNVQLTIDIKGNDSVGKAAEKTTSLRTELKKLKQELASGNLTGEAFLKARERAGQLQDTIGDINQEVKNLSSDSRKLDAFLTLGQGIAGGFAAAQGAMALFGDENEDVQKALLKVQSAVAVLNGLQAIHNTLNKSSALITEAQSIKLKVLTFVQTRYTAAVGASTGAMKVMRIVGASLGIGLIVAAIGLLIANFDKVKAVVMNVVDRFKNLGSGVKNILSVMFPFIGVIRLVYAGLEKLGVFAETAADRYEKLEKANQKQSKQMQREIDLMEAQGASARDLYLAKHKQLMLDYETMEAKRKLIGLTTEEQEAQKDLANSIKVLNAEETKRQEDDAKTKQEKIDKANEEAAKKRKEETDKKKEQAKREAEELQKIIDEATKIRREKDFTDKAKEEAELGRITEAKIKIAKGNAEAIKLIEDASLIELQAIRDKYAKEEAEKKKESDKLLKDLIEQRRVDDLSVRDKELNDITEKYAKEAELAKGQAELLAEIETDKDNALREKRKQFDAEDASLQEEADNVRLEQIANTAAQAGQLINQIAGKNKAAALTALALEKGAAIANVVVNTQREIAAYRANPTWSLLPDGGAAIKATNIIAAKVRAGISIASISAAGLSGAKNITSGGGGGSVQPPNIRGSQTTNEPIQPQPTKVFVTETDIRSVTRKVDGIYTQATIQ